MPSAWHFARGADCKKDDSEECAVEKTDVLYYEKRCRALCDRWERAGIDRLNRKKTVSLKTVLFPLLFSIMRGTGIFVGKSIVGAGLILWLSAVLGFLTGNR